MAFGSANVILIVMVVRVNPVTLHLVIFLFSLGKSFDGLEFTCKFIVVLSNLEKFPGTITA